ncbi:hypothetical protein PILCRDRAFT_13735 [Piloderma croceum F 1598]|uniref:Uncharacterized protein n=1 Tax=Piloderma croceum (strain F 1598) TaxID=765440 RepID=A0A0C3F604_PILCF|nr:hypothetical protein PILCRDRAFT_13735 [Piloderma croceum F 1598]
MRVSRWRQSSDPDCGAFRTGWSPHSSSKATGRSFCSIGFAEAARAFPPRKFVKRSPPLPKRSHLQSDYHEVRLLLDRYNLTAISLQEVEKRLRQLTGEDDEEEYDEDEDEGDDGDGKGDDGGDGDFGDGSAGPFVDAE